MAKSNGILSMDPEHCRELDGVVFDLDSFARHCQPAEEAPAEPEQNAAPVQDAAPAPVFAVDPRHDGWYPAEDGQPPVPIMAGALPPGESVEQIDEQGAVVVTRTVWTGGGSGSGSGSYTTSYTTSFRISFFGSGAGSYCFGSGVFAVGGYGLELV